MAIPLAALKTGLDIVGGVAGLFGGKRGESKLEKAQREALERKARMQGEVWDKAKGYNAAAEDAAAIKGAQEGGAKTLADALDMRRMRHGAGADGDTRFAWASMGDINRVGGPVQQAILNLESTRTQRELQALESAIQTSDPGELANGYQTAIQTESARRAQNQASQVAGQTSLAHGLDSLLGAGAANSDPNSGSRTNADPNKPLPYTPLQLGTKKKSLGSNLRNYVNAG